MPTTRPRPAPQDHLPPNLQKGEALDEPVTFAWDDEEWTVIPHDATSLEFLAALEDERMVTALRILLGREQADRLVKGRHVEQLEGFFTALGDAVGTGNR